MMRFVLLIKAPFPIKTHISWCESWLTNKSSHKTNHPELLKVSKKKVLNCCYTILAPLLRNKNQYYYCICLSHLLYCTTSHSHHCLAMFTLIDHTLTHQPVHEHDTQCCVLLTDTWGLSMKVPLTGAYGITQQNFYFHNSWADDDSSKCKD